MSRKECGESIVCPDDEIKAGEGFWDRVSVESEKVMLFVQCFLSAEYYFQICERPFRPVSLGKFHTAGYRKCAAQTTSKAKQLRMAQCQHDRAVPSHR